MRLGRYCSCGDDPRGKRTLARSEAQIVASDMVMVADLGAPETAKIFLGPIRAGAVEAVGFLMVDPLHFKAIMPGRNSAPAEGERGFAFGRIKLDSDVESDGTRDLSVGASS